MTAIQIFLTGFFSTLIICIIIGAIIVWRAPDDPDDPYHKK